MFIQVLRGKTNDPEAAKASGERWQKEMKPGAKGFLGSTAGVADDGTYIGVIRFASEADARANSDRPEQGKWSEENSKHFEGGLTFYDCPDVDVIGSGDFDSAGFVQVMFFRPKDAAALRGRPDVAEKVLASRPDLLGETRAFATDGTVIETAYFTSEDAARKAETSPLPADIQPIVAEFRANAGEIEFVDLRDPQMHGA